MQYHSLRALSSIVTNGSKAYVTDLDHDGDEVPEGRPGLHIIALDEPSSVFHPRAISSFLAELNDLKLEQMVISSHSIDLLRMAMVTGSIVSICSKHVATKASIDKPLLESLGLDSSWLARPDEMAQLISNRRLLYVDNQGDYDFLDVWMRRVDTERATAFNRCTVPTFTSGKKTVQQYLESANAAGIIYKH